MSIILQTSNFVGYQALAQGTLQTSLLQLMITRYEQQAIEDILGLTVTPTAPVSLATAFIAECTVNYPNGPTTPVYQTLFNYLAWQTGGKLWRSMGMVDILTSVVFYWHIINKSAYDTASGVASANIDAGNKLKLNDGGRFAASRYNNAVDSIHSLQRYLQAGNGQGGAGNGGQTDYPNFIRPRKEWSYKYIF